MTQKETVIDQIVDEVELLKVEKKYNEAIEILQKALIEHNNDYRLYEELADIYLTQSKYDKSKKAIDFALKLNPDSPTGAYLKWFLSLVLNKVKEAIKFLEKSNKLMTNNSEVLRNLWYAYTLDWQKQKWIFILKRAQFLNPDDALIKEDLAMALIDSWEILEWTSILRQVKK